MEEYKALVAYVGVALVIFIGGLVWGRYRVSIKRRMNIREYQDTPEKDSHSKHTHTAVGA